MPSYDPLTNVELRWWRSYLYGYPINELQYRTQSLGEDGNRFKWTEWKAVPTEEKKNAY